MGKFKAPCRHCTDGFKDIDVPDGYRYVADIPTMTLAYIQVPFECEKCKAKDVAFLLEESTVYGSVKHKG